MENHKKSSYAIIPCYILDDENIEEGAKNLYARISMLSDEGRCWATNEYFAEKHKVTTRCIQNWLKQLKDAEYIDVEVEKGGFQTKRNIWITNDFKKQFTKRNTIHPLKKSDSPPPDAYFASSIETNNNCTNKQQQPGSSCSFSDAEKVKAMETIKLGEATMQRALRFTLNEIKVAIECCLTAHKPIDNIDGYFMSALTEKWQPKPTKLDKTKANADAEAVKEREWQLRQQKEQEEIQRESKRVYLEAKQLEIAFKQKMTDEHKFTVTENCISMRIEVQGFNGKVADNRPLTEYSLQQLKSYIDKYLR